MQGNMTQLSCFFHRTNYRTCMFVRVRFGIPFLISYIQLATRSFVLSFCGLVSFFFSLFPFSLVIYTHTYMYVYICVCM